MSCNPVGDAGAVALAQGLAGNTSLLRLSITSCGLKSTGAEHIMTALRVHPRLMTLNIGQNYATDDLNARFNWLEDGVVPSVKSLVKESKTLRMLELGKSCFYHGAISHLLYSSIIATLRSALILNHPSRRHHQHDPSCLGRSRKSGSKIRDVGGIQRQEPSRKSPARN